MDSATLLIGLAVGCFVLAARRHPELLRMHPDAAGHLTKTQDAIIALLALGAYLIAWSVDMPKIASFLGRNPWSLVPLLWLAWWATHQGARVMVKRLFIAFLVTSFVKIGSSFKSECWSAHTDACPFSGSLHQNPFENYAKQWNRPILATDGLRIQPMTPIYFNDFGLVKATILPNRPVMVKVDPNLVDRLGKRLILSIGLVLDGDPSCIMVNYSHLLCPGQEGVHLPDAPEYYLESLGGKIKKVTITLSDKETAR